MIFSLRNACWCLVIVNLSVSLSVLIARERDAFKRMEREESERSFLRTLHNALDEDFPQGWTLERDNGGKLFVRPKVP